MRLLLDTNIVIRLRQDGRQIDRTTRRIIEDAAAVYVSAASIWEIAIKASARKLVIDLAGLEAGLLEAGTKPLPITWTHARRAHDIALSHPDPFDRLLLAQAVCEPLHLLTSDERLAQYGSELVITA
ncbi:MAG TPA: type II toxin-antitoxin system VapC family toxin [Xanthobacteraceae bacterium]|nr:type II toxin-antitoxin system VapC family toxin [Xanthobacteraceae bacterium]